MVGYTHIGYVYPGPLLFPRWKRDSGLGGASTYVLGPELPLQDRGATDSEVKLSGKTHDRLWLESLSY